MTPCEKNLLALIRESGPVKSIRHLSIMANMDYWQCHRYTRRRLRPWVKCTRGPRGVRVAARPDIYSNRSQNEKQD